MFRGINENGLNFAHGINAINETNTNRDYSALSNPIPSDEAAASVQNSTTIICDMINNENVDPAILRNEIYNIANTIQGAIIAIKNNGGRSSIDFNGKLDLMSIQSNLIKLTPYLQSITDPDSILISENNKIILRNMLHPTNGGLTLVSGTLQSILNTLF
ncbi:MAG: hypothetical protein LBB20_02000 [Puniceicoccales bacterium]|jgi:hypothetical protein|nr:hypothetical protein [Puniceicoccales bacterium]